MPQQPRKKPAAPITVVLGGETWQVLWRRVRGCWGVTCYGSKEIRMDPSTKIEGNEREIFLHECLHALFPHVDEEIIASAGKELDDALEAMDL